MGGASRLGSTGCWTWSAPPGKVGPVWRARLLAATRRVGRRWPWAVLLFASLTLHLWQLGERSLHHDESIHAHGSWVLFTTGSYHYDPTYHGPLLYYLSAVAFLVEDSDFTARLPVALAGVSLVLVAFALRRTLGERSAWWTGLLATVSPLYLFYGRFLRQDLLEVATASAAAVMVLRAVRGRPRAWVWAGVWAGLALATTEVAYVTAALVGLTWLTLAMGSGLRQAVPATLRWLWGFRFGIAAAVATTILVAIPLYTVGFSHVRDWDFPLRAVSYWWGQHTVERVWGPWWHYLPRLALYELLPIVAAVLWVVRRRRRLHRLELALLVFGLESVAMYCYLGEKVPWLAVHQVWAFLPLAGCQLARTFGAHGRWWSRAVAGVALALTTTTALVANFVLPEISPRRDRVEALHYVQTCPEVKEVVAEGAALAAAGADPAAVVVGEAGWPLTWYWRRVPVWWQEPEPGMRPPLVLCDPGQEAAVRRSVGPGYDGEQIPLRAWWPPPDNPLPSASELLRYVVTRRPWSVIGSSEGVVLRRSEEPPGAREVPVPESLAVGLGVTRARLLGEGWLFEPRGLAVTPEGTLAVADVGLSAVVLFEPDGTHRVVEVPDGLQQPEAVAWTPEGVLVIADTWGQRVVLLRLDTGGLAPLPEPEGGWYGPRGLAVSPRGRLAVSDTGNKRVVLISPGATRMEIWGSPGGGPGELVEPVGLAFLDEERLLVCDTGNRRLQVLTGPQVTSVAVPLPGTWTDFYSRPQVAVLAPDRWLASDTPAGGLVEVVGGEVRRHELRGDEIEPTGLAVQGSTLWLGDRRGWVWQLELSAGE